MRKVRARSAAVAVAAAAAGALATLDLASCVSEPSLEELATQSVVITQSAPGTDFAVYKTFAIGDSITLIQQGEGDGAPTITGLVDPSIATPTLEAIATELSARGYRRVDRTAQPDLGVATVALIRLNAVVPYGAWWGYGAATGGYWGYGGSNLSTGISGSGIGLWKSGALVIELYDLRAAREAAAAGAQPTSIRPLALLPDGGTTASITAVWAAFIYGVIGGGLEPQIKGPPIAGIQQAFAQSPYLRTAP